jgi:hypothetical protein
VETLDDEQGFFFIHLHLFSTGIGKGGIEPFVERFDRVEDFGQDEIEQSPQFGKIVLLVSSNFGTISCDVPEEGYQSRSIDIESNSTR